MSEEYMIRLQEEKEAEEDIDEPNEREKEFLKCLGNGKTIIQCENENDGIDEPDKLKQQCIFCGYEAEAESQEELAQKMFDHQFNHNSKAMEVLQ